MRSSVRSVQTGSSVSRRSVCITFTSQDTHTCDAFTRRTHAHTHTDSLNTWRPTKPHGLCLSGRVHGRGSEVVSTSLGPVGPDLGRASNDKVLCTKYSDRHHTAYHTQITGCHTQQKKGAAEMVYNNYDKACAERQTQTQLRVDAANASLRPGAHRKEHRDHQGTKRESTIGARARRTMLTRGVRTAPVVAILMQDSNSNAWHA